MEVFKTPKCVDCKHYIQGCIEGQSCEYDECIYAKEAVSCSFAPEMDWLLSLIADKGLLRLRDVVVFRQGSDEYFRNPKCYISCATMTYILSRIDAELKWRRENGVQIEY